MRLVAAEESIALRARRLVWLVAAAVVVAACARSMLPALESFPFSTAGPVDERPSGAEGPAPGVLRSAAPRSAAPRSDAPRSAALPITFERLSVEQGLSQSTVNCILQDRQGFMWFGTKDGLNRFDGQSFRVYRHDPPDAQSPGHDHVVSIVEDEQGVLWIGTYGGGLDRFDPRTGRWRHYRHDPQDPGSLAHDNVRYLYLDRSGALWIATHGGGLDRFERGAPGASGAPKASGAPGAGPFTHFQPDPDDPSSLSDWLIDSVYEDRAGGLWVGSNNQGLARFDRGAPKASGAPQGSGAPVSGAGTFTHYRHDPGDPQSLSANLLLTAIVEDAEGMLWVATFDGLNRFDPRTGRAVRYAHDPDDPRSLSHNIVQTLHLDRSGTLWVGTAGGLDRFDAQTGTFAHYRNDPGDAHSLSSDLVLSIGEDRAGGLWIGTMGGGVNRVERAAGRFRQYTTRPGDPNSLSNPNVEAIWEDAAGVLWIGTSGGGLNRFDRADGTWHAYRHDPADPDSLPHDIVSAILEDRSGRLWIGTAWGGLSEFDRASGRFTRYAADADRSLSDSAVRTLYEDRRGLLWIGTHGDGAAALDPETGHWVHYEHDPDDARGARGSLGGDWIRTFYEDREGRLWIGTRDAGLDRFDRGAPKAGGAAGARGAPRAGGAPGGDAGRFVHYRHDPGDPHSLGPGAVEAIHQDASGAIWIGTDGGGLSRLEPETGVFTRYGVREGLPSSAVVGILEDARGNLWLSTGNGVSRFDPRRGTFRNYDARDGLQNSVFVGGAGYQGARGEFLFGGFNGVTAFYPARIEDNPTLPPVVLTALAPPGERPAEYVRELTLRRPNAFFEFEYAVLNYEQADKNRSTFMLEGFDAGWNDAGTRHFGSYGNLPAGEYTLRVKGSNNDGVWNEEGVSIRVTVVPQLWERWWFWGTAALVLAGGVAGGYRLRLRRVEARSRRLERLVDERTAELEAFYRAEEKTQRHLAALEERQRLARDLHDAVTQTLFSISLIAEVLPRLWEQNPEDGRRRLEQVRLGARSALAEMRTLLLELRPAGLSGADLGDLLRQLGEAVAGRSQLSVTVDAEGTCDLPPDVHVAFYRIAQEALNNVTKHARAGRVWVRLQCAPDGTAVLSVRDDGGGFDPERVPPDHLGLGIMHERAASVGARLAIESAPGQGTEVRLLWAAGEEEASDA